MDRFVCVRNEGVERYITPGRVYLTTNGRLKYDDDSITIDFSGNNEKLYMVKHGFLVEVNSDKELFALALKHGLVIG